MRPTEMLQAVLQRIFFAHFGDLDNVDFELQNHHKYLKAIAHELKFGIADLELVFH